MDTRRAPFSEQVRVLTGGEGADVVMGFVSNADTLPQSYGSIRKAGRLVFVGYTPGLPVGRNVLAVYGISESVAKPACPELVRGLTGFTYCQQALLCTRS